MKTKAYYKQRYGYYKEMEQHYSELFTSAVGELKAERLQVSHLKQVLDEVKVLLDKGVDSELIQKVIEFGEERSKLDMAIHNNLLFKGK